MVKRENEQRRLQNRKYYKMATAFLSQWMGATNIKNGSEK